MDFRWLQDFLSLAETGSFTAAAEAQHSSQPAFSRRIQLLEACLGAELIDRTRYPTTLTPAGEQFRKQAAEMVQRLIDARGELHGDPAGGRETITIALPHALALARFPGWWTDWRGADDDIACRLLVSNVHDAVTAHVAGLADLLICFHHAQQPIFLDPGHYERIAIGTEWLRPYAAARGGRPKFALPGIAKEPLPLLSYSSGAFLGRMVSLILQSAPETLHAAPVFESDMADALLGMAVAGQGIAWLPECTAARAVAQRQLLPAGDKRWSLELTVFAYCDRSQATPAVSRLMQRIATWSRRDGSRQQDNPKNLTRGVRQ
jgi:LysR family transcriptional regulator, hypochlorite-specific transcription factor HypT